MADLRPLLLAALLLAAVPTAAVADDEAEALPPAAVEGAPLAADALPVDAVPVPAREILRRAFDNRFRLDARASLEVTLVARTGATDVKRADLASKWIDGQIHSIGRFTYPEDMRDLAMLRLGHKDKTDEYFMWLPEFRRLRRISEPPKADMFLGSDANFEDIERRKPEDYRIEVAREVEVEGEAADLVVAIPVYDSGYGRVEYLIARRDASILEQRHYKRGADRPFKILRAPREHVIERGGHAIPTWLVLEDLERGTRTELRVVEIEVNPTLSDRLFSTRSLTQEARLPPIR